jgi:hypothetical protein
MKLIMMIDISLIGWNDVTSSGLTLNMALFNYHSIPSGFGSIKRYINLEV